jgi:tRNA 2-thiouridine synthesizing protein D
MSANSNNSAKIINVVVSGGLAHSSAVFSALNFAKAALSEGHQINGVFFYASAVEVSNKLLLGLEDELDLSEEWIELSKQYGFALNVCVSATERRGVMSEEQASQANESVVNMSSDYTVVGLGALQEQSLASDRTVSFR